MLRSETLLEKTFNYIVQQASDGDKERGTHCDNSEVARLSLNELSELLSKVSANICLTSSHTGGELYLLGQDGEAAGDLTLQHRNISFLLFALKEPASFNQLIKVRAGNLVLALLSIRFL